MRMADTMHTTIILNNTARCRVTTDAAQESFYSTPQLVALGLLRHVSEASTFIWHDYLATHNLAIGHTNTQVIYVGILPRQARTIQWYGDNSSPPHHLTFTFPRCLLIIVTKACRTHYTELYTIADDAFPTITCPDPCLIPYPYGNVYEDGHICWGSISTATILTLPALEAAFFASGFNRDLWRHGPQSLGDLAGSGVTELHRDGIDTPMTMMSALNLVTHVCI